MTNPVQRAQPQNLEAERALLGAILIDPEVVDEVVASGMTKGDFYATAHATIYETACAMATEGEKIDVVLLRGRLHDAGTLGKVGGAGYITDLFDHVPTSANWEYYAGIVRDKALRRHTVKVAKRLESAAYDEDKDALGLIGQADGYLVDLLEDRRRETQSIKDVLKGVFAALESGDSVESAGAPTLHTGLLDLDDMVRIAGGMVAIIAARPSMGKTSLALNILGQLGLHDKWPVMLVSIENSADQMGINLMCAMARVDAYGLRKGTLGDAELGEAMSMLAQLSEAPVWVNDDCEPTIQSLRAMVRAAHRRAHIRAVFVDYLQLVSDPTEKGRGSSRETEITAISRGLKALARELNIPVIALAQLNRENTKRKNKRPELSDLRESGSIEQDADVVVLVHRPDYYDPEDQPGLAELIVAKQRNGPTGIVKVLFEKSCMRFENLSAAPAPPARPALPAPPAQADSPQHELGF